jgi:hypothetical protein
MALQNRVSRLEAVLAAQVRQATYETSEETGQRLDEVIRSLNEGTHTGGAEPWIIRPAPPDAGPATRYLHNLINRIAENELKNQSG